MPSAVHALATLVRLPYSAVEAAVPQGFVSLFLWRLQYSGDFCLPETTVSVVVRLELSEITVVVTVLLDLAFSGTSF